MKFRIIERQEAVDNVLQAFNWYESQKEGLGFAFLQSLDQFYDSLERNPEAYSFLQKPLRQGKIETFPSVVVFEIQDTTVIIFKIFNTHQEPGKKIGGTKF